MVGAARSSSISTSYKNRLFWLTSPRSLALYFFSCNYKRRNFSLVARYFLKFTRFSLLVVKSPVTRCKICSLLVAEVACCKKSLVTRCRSCSLQKITCYSLQNSLVARWRSCSLQKSFRYLSQNSLVTRCRSYSLQKNTRHSLWKQTNYWELMFI